LEGSLPVRLRRVLLARIAFVRNFRPGHRDHRHEVI
jgi:hypothetical protein